MNAEIRQFKQTLIAITNACNLPIEVKRLVFAEIQSQIDNEANKMIALEMEQINKQEEKTND